MKLLKRLLKKLKRKKIKEFRIINTGMHWELEEVYEDRELIKRYREPLITNEDILL